MVSKWIKLERGVFGFSASATLFDKIVFYAGRSDTWGIGAEVSFYDRSITLSILNLYMGVELWYGDSDIIDFVPRSKTNLTD